MAGYRRAAVISDVSSSRIASLAVGEVRVSGVVEAAELSLLSPLQSERCVYYLARITETRDRDRHTVFSEERAVGFRVRDETGSVRVFPRGARWDVPWCLDEHDGAFSTAVGLRMRTGPAIQVGELDRQVQIANLLTVHQPADLPDTPRPISDVFSLAMPTVGGRERHYEEARIEIGDQVTIVGTARPFDQLPDPTGADEDSVDGDLTSDPEIEADLAAARAAGTLATTPADAWGNAAIPGFGIGHPTRAPHLDPDARPEPLADAATSEKIARMFDIAAEELVVAAAPECPLLIAQGPPGAAEARNQGQFVLGLLGALLAIGAAFVLAFELTGGIRL
jgi:hypothetical protein